MNPVRFLAMVLCLAGLLDAADAVARDVESVRRGAGFESVGDEPRQQLPHA
jgi:hypothetical protein